MNIFKHGKLCAEYLGLYLRGTRGVAAMEYAVIVGVVVVGVGLAITAFQVEIQEFINAMAGRLSSTGTGFSAPGRETGTN